MQLVPRPRGSLHSLAQQAVQSSLGGSLVLGPGECQLRVMCVGLNFRDVLNVLGMYPGDPGDPGGDCSGVVAKVGSADSRLSVGLPAFGLAIGSLGTHVNVVEDLMVPMPPGVSFDAAATAPTVFVTVELAYRQAAGLRSGERVLVHAATGGVGLAATQVVTAAGADVYATAGSSYKRALLRGMSVQDVASSRDIRYVTEVGGLVGGIGIVLNSLTSPGMVPATIAGVQLGGRMVEIGKRDIWSPGAVRCERRDMAYNLEAVDFLPPPCAQTALLQVAQALGSGAVTALPGLAYGLGTVPQAMRVMSQAKHIGKVVVRTQGSGPDVGTAGLQVLTGGTQQPGLSDFLLAGPGVQLGPAAVWALGPFICGQLPDGEGPAEAVPGFGLDVSRAGQHILEGGGGDARRREPLWAGPCGEASACRRHPAGRDCAESDFPGPAHGGSSEAEHGVGCEPGQAP